MPKAPILQALTFKAIKNIENVRSVVAMASSLPSLTSLTLVIAPELETPRRLTRLFGAGKLAWLQSLHVDVQVKSLSLPARAACMAWFGTQLMSTAQQPGCPMVAPWWHAAEQCKRCRAVYRMHSIYPEPAILSYFNILPCAHHRNTYGMCRGHHGM